MVATDAEWETKIEWHRTNVILGESEVTISVDIPADQGSEGVYRIGEWLSSSF